MSEQPILEMLGAQRLLEQGIVMKINHSRAKVIAGSPISVNLPKFFRVQRLTGRSQL